MTKEELSELSDQELLVEAKKMKSNAIMNALIIGFLVGVIVYSILVNSLGLFTLIPLFYLFKVFHKPERKKALNFILNERGLNQ